MYAEQSLHWVNAFFGFDRHGTTLTREVVAGLTTFTTMSYIVVVNPAILSAAGIPAGPSFVSTLLVAGKIGELKPGLWVLTALSLLFFVFYPYS